MQNFDGLGIGFEVQDNGAEQKVSGISRSFQDLWSSVKDASTSVPRATAGIARGLNRLGERSSHYVGMVSTAIGGMIDSAMDPKLDSAYASLYAGFNKEFSALTAGMKDTEGALTAARKRIGGIAQGMGEDMNQAAQSWVAFEKQGIALDRMLGTKGLSNTIKQLIKTTSVFGLEGKQLANIAGGLKRGFGFTEEQIGALGDKIVAVGREFNMGREAIQAWPQIMTTLNKELAAFGEKLTPQKLDSLTTSIVQLGGGFHEALGVDATEATELAINAFTVLASEGKNIARMAYGMGGPFSEMGKEIMAAGDDLNQVFDVMASKDPLKFMDMLREIGKVAQQRGGETGVAFQRLHAVINDTLGPDVAFATAGNWDRVTEKMKKMPDVIASSKGTLKEVAQTHWKSSLTAGDAWEMMMNNMKDKVFRLSRGEMNKWKKDMRQGFQDSFGVVKAFADDKGPIGELTRKLLLVQRVGLSALMPSLGSLAPMLSGITQQALPMLTALGSMGVRFGDIGKLAGVGGGAYLLFQTLTKGPGAVIEKFTMMRNSIFDVLETKIFTGAKHKGVRKSLKELRHDLDTVGIFGTVQKQLKKIPWGDVWDTIWGQTDKILRSLGKALHGIPWEAVGKSVFNIIGKGIKAVGGGIWDVIFGSDGGKAIDPFSKLIRDGVAGALNIIKDTAKGALKGLWDSIFHPDSLQDTFDDVLKFATTGFGALFLLSKGFRKKIGAGIWSMFTAPKKKPGQQAVDYYGAGLPGMIPGIAPKRAAPHRGRTQEASFEFGKERIALGEERKNYRQELLATRSLSGGVFLPQNATAPAEMVPGPGGWVPKGGLEGGKVRQATRRERFQQWRTEKRERFAQTKIGKVAGGAKRGLQKIGGLGGVSAIGGVIESTQQMSENNVLAQRLAQSTMLSDQEKFLVKTESTFLNVTNVIDSMFLGIPGMIGNALGIGERDVTGFYHTMVAGAEVAIGATVETFQFLGRSVGNIWDGISAGAQMLFARIDHGFSLVANSSLGILYDIGEYLQTTVKGWGSKLMYPFEWFSFQMKSWMADFMESVFGKPGEENAITKILSSVLGEDTVKGIQKYGKQVRDEQRAILGGEKTFDDMWLKQEQQRQKADKASWDTKRQHLKDERRTINDSFQDTKNSIERQQKAAGIEAISQDFQRTKAAIAEQTDRLMMEAATNAERAEAARKRLDFEEEVKTGARSAAMESAERARQEAEGEKERRKKRRGRRARTQVQPDVEQQMVQKPRMSTIVSPEERASASSAPADLAKILEENKKTVADIQRTMATMQASVQDLANRPINMTVVSKIDGKKVAEAVETQHRKTARF